MKKKTWAIVLSVVLVLALAVTGTIAYLTDRDSAVNVFTWGNVDITLNEEFEQGATLIPGTVIEKDVTVKNTGRSDAFVWVKIAMPATLDNDDASKNVIHFNYAKESAADGYWNWLKEDGAWNVQKEVDIDGVKYNVYTVLYETALKPGEATEYSAMTQVYLDTKVDIDPEGNLYLVDEGNANAVGWNINTDGAPVIYVSAYATQAEGFVTVAEAYAAYATQWGTNGDEWATPSLVAYTDIELADFVTVSSNITLGNDIEGNATVAEDADITLSLNKKKLDGVFINNGSVSISNGEMDGDFVQNNGEATYTDITMNTGTPYDYASIGRDASVTTYNNVDIVSGGGGVAAADGATVVFNSGSIAVNSESTSGRYVFYTQGAGSTITINDGTFSFSKTLNQKRAYVYANADTTVIINGGTFGPASTRSGYTAGILGEGEVIIKGGTFGFNPSNWVADGYEAVKDGSVWVVSAK